LEGQRFCHSVPPRKKPKSRGKAAG